MTKVKKKLEEVHVNLWNSPSLLFFFANMYITIILNIKIYKTWIIYLHLKDKFIDIF